MISSSVLESALAQLYADIALCQQAGIEDDRLATLLNNLAVVHFKNGRHADADYALQRSAAIWETLGDPAKVAMAFNNRAAVDRDMYAVWEGERIFQLALRLWKKHGLPGQDEMRAGNDSLLETGGFREKPIWIECPQLDGKHFLKNYSEKVLKLKQGVVNREKSALDTLQETLKTLGPWYHYVELGGGISTGSEPAHYPMSRWEVLEPHVPLKLNGESLLDIGCNSGFFSLQMKSRGAGRIVGIDIMPHSLAQARFLAHWFELHQELYQLDVYDVESLETTFDNVMFVGVLYHLKHPLYALEKVSNVCTRRMYFQSAIRGPLDDCQPADDYAWSETEIFGDPGFPRMYFIEKSFNGDESNWWFATRSCLKAMLRVSGFRRITDTALPDHLICSKA